MLIHSFIHSFYSASSSPLLLRGAPEYSIDTVSEIARRSATVKDLPKVYVAARVGFETTTLRKEGTEANTDPLISIATKWLFHLS